MFAILVIAPPGCPPRPEIATLRGPFVRTITWIPSASRIARWLVFGRPRATVVCAPAGAAEQAQMRNAVSALREKRVRAVAVK